MLGFSPISSTAISSNQGYNILVNGWVLPLSLPVLRTPQPQNWTGIFSAPYTVSYKETTTLDRWFVPFREPVRSIPKNASGFFAPPDTTNFAETPNVDKWWKPFSEPVRRKPEPQNWTGVITQPARQPEPSMRWFRNFDVPVLPPKKIIPPSFFYYDKMTPNPPPPMATWFQAWREPVRLTPFIRQSLDTVSWYWPPIIPIPPVAGKITLTYMPTSTIVLLEEATTGCFLSYKNASTVTLVEKPL